VTQDLPGIATYLTVRDVGQRQAVLCRRRTTCMHTHEPARAHKQMQCTHSSPQAGATRNYFGLHCLVTNDKQHESLMVSTTAASNTLNIAVGAMPLQARGTSSVPIPALAYCSDRQTTVGKHVGQRTLIAAAWPGMSHAPSKHISALSRTREHTYTTIPCT
jgi:hypothetical protein